MGFGTYAGDQYGLGTNGFEVSLNYLTGVPDQSCLATTELQLCLKGLQKRDATTREKSAGNLLKVVETKSSNIDDDLLLISWCQLYAKLAIDESKRVRSLSHQIQSKFVIQLGRKYLKYLRDTIGIWLAGLFDSDRSVARVCKQSVDEAFGNNAEKVANLWKIYTQPLFNYIYQVVVVEDKTTLSDERFTDKDESEAKYQRVLQGAILLFIQITNKLNEESLKLKDDQVIILMLENTRFLDLATTKDLQLKRSWYQLVRVLVVTKQMSTVIDDNHLFAGIAHAAVQGLKIKKVQPVLYSSSIVPILDTLVILTKHDPSFWAAIKKSANKLQEILRIGSVQSDPVYYEVVRALLAALPEELMPRDYKSMEPYIIILRNDVNTERVPGFKQRAWKCYISFVKTAPKSDNITNTLIKQAVQTLDSPRALSTGLLTELASLNQVSDDILDDINSELMNSLPGGKLEQKYEKQFVENFISLLVVAKSDLLEVLLTNSIESLEDETEDHPTLALLVIDIYIRKAFAFDQISQFIDKIDQYFASDFIDQPFKVFVDYSCSKLCDHSKVSPTANRIFVKLDEFGDADKVVRSISSIKHFDLKQAPDIESHLLERSEVIPSSKDSLFELLTPEILANLYSNSNSSEDFDQFIDGCLHHYQDVTMIQFANDNPDFIKRLLASSDSESSSELLEKFEQHIDDEQFKKLYFQALTANLEVESLALTFVDRIQNLPPSIWADYLPESVTTSAPSHPNGKLSIANALGTGIYLFGESDVTAALPVLRAFFYASIFKQYPELIEQHRSLIIDLAIIGEAAVDISFLDALEGNMNTIIETLHDDSSDCIRTLFKDASAEDLFAIPIKSDEWHLYYSYRLLEHLLPGKLSSEDPKSLHGADLAVYLDCNKDQLLDEKLSRSRNGTLANLIGLRTSKDIVSIGLKNLILLNKFIDLDDVQIPEGVQLFPAQRLIMAINSLGLWLDCDIAYEAEFNPVRICLLEFVTKYIKSIYYVCDSNYPSDLIDKVFELGVRLCSESLNMVDADGSIELAFYSLKAFILLDKYKEQIDSWQDSIDDMENELVDILLNQLNSENNCQANHQINELWARALPLVPVKKLLPEYERFFEFVPSSNTQVQRLSVSIIAALIPKIQDNLVVEFTLDKGNEIEAKLPPSLLQNIDDPLVRDDFDYQSLSTKWTYLWSWYLIILHFKGITQKIRDNYTTELGDDTIFEFLTFVVREINVAKFKVPLESDPAYITDYTPVESDEPAEELPKLLVNLFYLVMDYLGGSLTQMWYAGIRDKQLKKATDTFMVKYVSPLLIDNIMNTLSDKTSLEDDSFKVKVNPNAKEIRCLAEIDDQTMEICITLPVDYPLSQIDVTGISRVGIDEKKWKSWLMSLQYVINFQNVSILDAIRHFKENVQSNFEGYEDCAICYSILNAVDHSTPNKVCPTCHHQFHSACLYRWFKSSGSATCPLCRGKFSFKKH